MSEERPAAYKMVTMSSEQRFWAIAGIAVTILGTIITVAAEPSLPGELRDLLIGRHSSNANTDTAARSDVGTSLTTIRIETDPDSADIYFDWQPHGRAPVVLSGRPVRGLLVAVGDGTTGAVRQINAARDTSLMIPLRPHSFDGDPQVVVLDDGLPAGMTAGTIRAALADEGIPALSNLEVERVLEAASQAGGLGVPAYRFWVVRQYDVGWVLEVSGSIQSQTVTATEVGANRLGDLLVGSWRSRARLQASLTNLLSGSSPQAFRGDQSFVSRDSTASAIEAFTRASRELASQVREGVSR